MIPAISEFKEPVNGNSQDPRLIQGTMTETIFMSEFTPCHDLSLQESPTKQSMFPPPKNLYLYHFNARIMSQRIAIVRIPV